MVFPLSSIEDLRLEIQPDHEVFRKAMREFSEREISKYVEEGERSREIPLELRKKAVELGLLALDVPTELGGQGSDYISLLIAIEEISRIWPSFSTYIMIHWMFNYAIMKWGNEELKRRYIPDVASGKRIVAFANTEPGAGSDVAGISSVAKKVGGYYIITGRKIFITNGDIADTLIITARTSPPSSEARWKGISMFVIDRRESDGLRVISRIETTGLKASHTAEIELNEVKVPEENLVGEEGMGFKYAIETFDYTRTIVASQALGIGQAAFELMSKYSLDRKAFEKKIAEFQIVQNKIAESLADLEASRLLTYWAGSLFKNNKMKEYIIAASLAKFFVTEAMERIVLRAMGTLGGYGVSTSSSLERMLRDLQILKTYEGTNDIQRITVARQYYYRYFGVKV
ncbi:MAG: acyl-CoA dehydrogenase family protein [Sulfolobaceae archaeon]